MARLVLVIALLAGAFAFVSPARALDARQPVYVVLADSLPGSFDQLTSSLRDAATAAGWSVAAVHDVAVDRNACDFHARVFVLVAPGWARQVLAHGSAAAFAVPVRLVLYEDEAGRHLAAVNPLSIARTIVAESGFEAPSEALLRDLGHIAATLHGRTASRGYGQVRDRGLIGRTMGVMAGGPFPEKVHVLASAAAGKPEDLAAFADRISAAIERGGARGRWQIRGAYRIDLAEQGVIVLGVSGAAMETKSFAIVGAGNDGSRSRYRCPGLAHAAAYPIEVVVYRDGGNVRAATIDGMYRMKMYFEDAGKMKFAANMGMPGSIEDEIRALVAGAVAATR